MATAGIGSGLDAQFGLAEETVWGTAVTPDRFFEFLSEGITDAPASLDSPPSLGRGMFARHDRTITYAMPATGPTVFRLTTKGFGKLLRLIFGDLTFTWPGSTNASQVLTFVALPTSGDTVTIDATVYTFRTALTAPTTSGEVLIGATFAESLRNLAMAINRGRGDGTWYGSLTPVHPTVVATYNATTLTATDKMARGASATDATTETLTNAGNVWTGAALAGGVNGTDATRLQTYTIPDRGTYGKSATIQIMRPSRDGIDRPFTYAGMKVTSWTLRVSLDGWVELEVAWTGKPATTATALATASFVADAANYNFTQMAVTVGAVSQPISSFEITGTWGIQTETRLLSNTLREPLANAFWSVTGTMNAEFTDMTAYTAFLAGTQAQLIATLTGGTIPTAASPYKTTITLPAMKYTGTTPSVTGPDVLQTPLPFMVYKNAADAFITCAYQSDDTAP